MNGVFVKVWKWSFNSAKEAVKSLKVIKSN